MHVLLQLDISLPNYNGRQAAGRHDHHPSTALTHLSTQSTLLYVLLLPEKIMNNEHPELNPKSSQFRSSAVQSGNSGLHQPM